MEEHLERWKFGVEKRGIKRSQTEMVWRCWEEGL